MKRQRTNGDIKNAFNQSFQGVNDLIFSGKKIFAGVRGIVKNFFGP
jgi:hypothetical protein